MDFFFQAEDGIRDGHVTGVQTCALPICHRRGRNAGIARIQNVNGSQMRSTSALLIPEIVAMTIVAMAAAANCASGLDFTRRSAAGIAAHTAKPTLNVQAAISAHTQYQ